MICSMLLGRFAVQWGGMVKAVSKAAGAEVALPELNFGGDAAKNTISVAVSEGDGLMVCKPKQEPAARVRLEVNGEPIELNSFAQNIISQTVIGMVRSLRGVGAIEKVSLSVETGGKAR